MNILYNFFKKTPQQKTNIIAPISGTIVTLDSVPDKVFSERIVGDGIAIQPNGKRIVAPITGKIGIIFKTMHAFSIMTKDGIELFVHFGIDTVLLKGKGFKQIAQDNQNITMGETIIEYDLKFLQKYAKSTITPIVISNMDQVKKIKKYSGTTISGKTIIMEVIK
ncbi:PTS system glucose-specific EIIA component [Buchnera aphidicola (Pterocallis alni)]|uniref:PTS glucose transporter subunit IIA n=1 Tax=Buchnera aphidicola TaxID=9 RepID=UPI003464069D